jgi:integrase
MTTHRTIAACRSQYLAEGGRESTWDGDYAKILKWLPQDKPLTPHRLRDLVLRWEPNTRSRQRACHAAAYLAKFASIDWHPGKLKGRYSAQPVDPARIPTDEQILEWFEQLKNPGWRWIYGCIATYGLRPHEALRADLPNFKADPKGRFWVPSNTKTGARRVWPCPPEWYYHFALSRPHLPKVNLDRTNDRLGHSASEYFGDTVKLPWHLYAMRHAWAWRAHREGLSQKAAAKMMGHSEAVHTGTYQAWFDDLALELEYQQMLEKRRSRKP